jgi:hypothetical protein
MMCKGKKSAPLANKIDHAQGQHFDGAAAGG